MTSPWVSFLQNCKRSHNLQKWSSPAFSDDLLLVEIKFAAEFLQLPFDIDLEKKMITVHFT